MSSARPNTTSRTQLNSLIVLVPLGLGLSFWIAIRWIDSKVGLFLKIEDQLSVFSSTVASFAFTAAGVLVAVVTFLLGLSDREFMKYYRRTNNTGSLMLIILVTVLTLFATFFSSLGLLAYPGLFHAVLASLILNLLQLAFILLIAFNLTRRSLES